MKDICFFKVALYACIFVSFSCRGQEKEITYVDTESLSPIQATGLPIRIPNDSMLLPELSDPKLQKRLEDEINKVSKWKSLVANKKMAIGIVDLTDVNNIRFAHINGNHMMYAASLPKIAVLLAATDAIENGELEETAEVKADMKIMISKSNNAATTRMIDRVGFQKIESILTCDRYCLYDVEFGGGLWVGKRYGGGGATNREPIRNLSHAATVTQVCRFYYLLAQGKLVNQERSEQMLEIMEDPALHHKFVNTLDIIAPDARLFRKSGSWKTYHSDSVLVWGKDPNRRYILVALVDDSSGEQIIRDLVMPVERALKK
ncbi:MAG: serine hydrolase [Chitinophagales bacterium]